MSNPNGDVVLEMSSNINPRPINNSGRGPHELNDVVVINPGNGKNVAESSQPLLETDTERPERPISGPEIDDLDENNSNKPNPSGYNPGVDDGFYDNAPTIPKRGDKTPLYPTDKKNDGPNERPFYYPPGFPEDPEAQDGRKAPDMNIYQQKKNYAQGMLDIALLTANASQLRYVLETGKQHPYYYPSIALISFSVVFQVAVGIGLILMSRYNVKEYYDICSADRINNFCVIGVFLITIINVFIASFSVSVNIV